MSTDNRTLEEKLDSFERNTFARGMLKAAELIISLKTPSTLPELSLYIIEHAKKVVNGELPPK